MLSGLSPDLKMLTQQCLPSEFSWKSFSSRIACVFPLATSTTVYEYIAQVVELGPPSWAAAPLPARAARAPRIVWYSKRFYSLLVARCRRCAGSVPSPSYSWVTAKAVPSIELYVYIVYRICTIYWCSKLKAFYTQFIIFSTFNLRMYYFWITNCLSICTFVSKIYYPSTHSLPPPKTVEIEMWKWNNGVLNTHTHTLLFCVLHVFH